MDTATLEQRMERLERANRRLKLGMLALAAVMVGFVCIAATTSQKVVRAQGFEITDSHGTYRGSLAVDADGAPRLFLHNKGATGGVGLGINADGSPGLALFGKQKDVRVALTVLAHGGPALVFRDENHGHRVLLSADTDEGPSLVFRGKDGKVLWKAP
jgi:hypothetical protein